VRTVKKKNQPVPQGRQAAATISDVARAAGVSTMTVSRVINRTGNVKQATLAAVDAAIARLNYAPNPAARSLAGAKQIRVGLLYSNPSAAYLSALLVGAVEEASHYHVQLFIEKCPPGGGGLAVARQLVAEGVDGLLLPPPMCDSQALIDYLGKVSTPCVVIASGVPPKSVASVGIDDFAAAHAMTTHLLDLGHTRIGFISGNPDQSASARRLQGYEQALRGRGIRPAPELIEPGLFTYRSGLDAAEKLLRLPTPPSAIFASNDDMAAATVAVAHSQGLAVPSDLSVCGFDDTLMATTIWPELTTVRQPIDDMSRRALEMLVDAVKARRTGQVAAVRNECMEYTLVRRHSDAAPRRRPPATPLRQG
jgi:LacI family transcriptional regulator